MFRFTLLLLLVAPVLSEADPTKKWFNLRYDLLTSDRTYSQLTSNEKAMVEAEAQQKTKTMSVAPNPAQNNMVVSFNAPETAHQSSLEIADINGRMIHQIDLSNYFGASQQIVAVDDLTSGIYFVRLRLNGILAGVEKMAVIR